MTTQRVGGATNRSGLTVAQQSMQDAIRGLDQSMQMFNNLPLYVINFSSKVFISFKVLLYSLSSLFNI